MATDHGNAFTLLISRGVARRRILTLRASCGAVYCNRSCLWVCLWVGVWVGWSVTTITRNCVHRSSPNWVFR